MKRAESFVRFVALVHRPEICWWPFPFMRPETGRPFGRFRLFTCATLYPLFFWSFAASLLFMKGGLEPDELIPLFCLLVLVFSSYYSAVAYCWNRFHCGPDAGRYH